MTLIHLYIINFINYKNQNVHRSRYIDHNGLLYLVNQSLSVVYLHVTFTQQSVFQYTLEFLWSM